MRVLLILDQTFTLYGAASNGSQIRYGESVSLGSASGAAKIVIGAALKDLNRGTGPQSEGPQTHGASAEFYLYYRSSPAVGHEYESGAPVVAAAISSYSIDTLIYVTGQDTDQLDTGKIIYDYTGCFSLYPELLADMHLYTCKLTEGTQPVFVLASQVKNEDRAAQRLISMSARKASISIFPGSALSKREPVVHEEALYRHARDSNNFIPIIEIGTQGILYNRTLLRRGIAIPDAAELKPEFIRSLGPEPSDPASSEISRIKLDLMSLHYDGLPLGYEQAEKYLARALSYPQDPGVGLLITGLRDFLGQFQDPTAGMPLVLRRRIEKYSQTEAGRTLELIYGRQGRTSTFAATTDQETKYMLKICTSIILSYHYNYKTCTGLAKSLGAKSYSPEKALCAYLLYRGDRSESNTVTGPGHSGAPLSATDRRSIKISCAWGSTAKRPPLHNAGDYHLAVLKGLSENVPSFGADAYARFFARDVCHAATLPGASPQSIRDVCIRVLAKAVDSAKGAPIKDALTMYRFYRPLTEYDEQCMEDVCKTTPSRALDINIVNLTPQMQQNPARRRATAGTTGSPSARDPELGLSALGDRTGSPRSSEVWRKIAGSSIGRGGPAPTTMAAGAKKANKTSPKMKGDNIKVRSASTAQLPAAAPPQSLPPTAMAPPSHAPHGPGAQSASDWVDTLELVMEVKVAFKAAIEKHHMSMSTLKSLVTYSMPDFEKNFSEALGLNRFYVMSKLTETAPAPGAE